MRDCMLISAHAPSRVEIETDEPVEIPSLASYVLISQEEQRLEVFSRNSDGSWTLRDARSSAVELKSIGCSLAVADVYRNPLPG